MTLRPTFPLDGSSGYGAEWLRAGLELGLAEGVIGAGDFKVTAAAAGGMRVDVAAGLALVKGDTGTSGLGLTQGLYLQPNDASIANAVTLTASHATLPRIDQIVLTVNDSSDLGSSGDTPTLGVVTGTATSGAQAATPSAANYRSGAGALPSNAVRLADILVPAASSAVTAGNIVDRRPWARGAFYTYADNAVAPTTSSTTFVDVDATHTSPRVELSGRPLIVTLAAGIDTNSIDGYLRVLLNGVSQGDAGVRGPFTTGDERTVRWGITAPAAGSALIQLQFRTTNVTSGHVLRTPWVFTVEESLRPSASN